jgi:hypothetical protein
LMDYVTVYRFQTWDSAQKRGVWRPLMGTREAIRRQKGEADLDSAVQVSEHEVDANGHYPKSVPVSAPDEGAPVTPTLTTTP